MRVATVDGLVTLFYDGSKPLFNWGLNLEWQFSFGGRTSDECKEYIRERWTWQQVIVMEGVSVIPEGTFSLCKGIKRVIFANTVIRIEKNAFYLCKRLVHIKFPISLEYIGEGAFNNCNLSSVFTPPRCREICDDAFQCNDNLSILNVSQDTELGEDIIFRTALAEVSPFDVVSAESEEDEGEGEERADPNMNTWLKNLNNDDAYALHRICSSYQPLKEDIHAIIQDKGVKAFREENSTGITPSQYLKENPYTDLKEMDFVRYYLLKKLGEVE